MFKKIYAASIWAPGAIPPDEWKYRNLKRMLLPIIDLAYVIAGISAALNGVPAIGEFFDPFVMDFFAYGLAAVSFGCLIGVAFPEFWPLETAAKSLLIGLMAGYVVALLLLTAEGDPNRGFVLMVAFIATCTPIWRLSLIGDEWSTRRAIVAGAA